MNFYEEIKQKQEENTGSICLFRIGVFYVGIGKDAVYLSEVLKLKRTCFKKGVCKVGIPSSKFYSYLREIAKIGVSVVVYEYNKEEMTKFRRIEELLGGEIIEEKSCLDCDNCSEQKKIMSLEKVQEIMRKLNEGKLM